MSLTVYKETQQLSEGVWVFERGHKEWCDEMNRNMEIINECVQRLNSHKTLTIKDEEGTILGTFDNQENKEIAVKQLFVDNWDLIKEVKYINGILTVTKLNGANIDIDLQIPTIPEPNTDVVTTATINGRTITFTKLNGDTFNVTVPDTVFPEIPEQNTNVVATASLDGNKITFTKLNGEMFDVTLPTTDISGLQSKLIAGNNITIEENVISASVDLSDYAKKSEIPDISNLQEKLVAGDNITIEENVISATSSGGNSAALTEYEIKTIMVD